APSIRAVASPMPRVEPVMTATLPSSLSSVCGSDKGGLRGGVFSALLVNRLAHRLHAEPGEKQGDGDKDHDGGGDRQPHLVGVAEYEIGEEGDQRRAAAGADQGQ